MDYSLSGLYTWRNCVSLGYPVLESFLTTYAMCDEQIICVDPDSDDATLELADAINKKISTARVVYFRWPKNVPGDGSVIGIASNFAYQNARTTHVVNVQADEIWPTQLMEWTRDNWKRVLRAGYDCIQYKVLNTEHNAQRFQGGQEWDGDKLSSDWNWQSGAGYNKSIKLSKKCPGITMAHDGWTFECALPVFSHVSQEYPIVHLHDMFRDHLIDLRFTAAMEIWTDREKYGHYLASAEGLRDSTDKWYGHPMWTEKVSPFDELLPDVVKSLIGKVWYKARLDLI